MDQLSQWDSGQCVGTLVLHADGTTAACSLELEGLACAGLSGEHLGGVITCDDLLGADGCEHCSRDALPVAADPWRHAVHMGRIATARRRCRVHLVVVGRPTSRRAMVVDRADTVSPGASTLH